MTSERTGFVWTWLPGETSPVPCGMLTEQSNGSLAFQYGRHYLERGDAMALFGLPLAPTRYLPSGYALIPGEVQDAAPDGWGRRVILETTGQHGAVPDNSAGLRELDYLLRSGSDRIGALDVQRSSAEYVPRSPDPATLEQLQRAAELIEEGVPLPAELDRALVHGTSVGGARPKATITVDGQPWLAKFSSSSDHYPVVGAEAASMFLAKKVGIETVDTTVVRSLGKEVILMRRFDRPPDGTRKHVVTALTFLGLDEVSARYGTYPDILEALRTHSDNDPARELFRRVAFNIAIGNTDDHVRNHSAFWNGAALTLTPAYDLSPTSRSGETASQAIAYGRNGERESNLNLLAKHAADMSVTRAEAHDEIDYIVGTIRDNWSEAADFAHLTDTQRSSLWGRQFLNPGALRDR